VEGWEVEDTATARELGSGIEEGPVSDEVGFGLCRGGSCGGFGASRGGAGFEDAEGGWEGGLPEMDEI